MRIRISFVILSFFILITFVLSGCVAETEVIHTTEATATTAADLDTELTVSFIDAGQGDATLIECAGEAMLIDAGLSSQGSNVVSYLNQQGINELKYCVATHPHADHIGGMSKVIYNVDVDTLVYPLCYDDSSIMNNVLDACDEKGVSYLNPEPFDTLTVGDATVTVLSPTAYADYGNINNNSLVLKLEYEDVSFLFMGDAEAEVEKELLKKNVDLSADVLKAGHHGSSTSSDANFVNAVNPHAAIISCGKDNDYGHPHRETLSTLNSRNIQIFRTDELSSIIAETDGNVITISAKGETLSTINAKESPNIKLSYTGNRNSKVFHLNSCDSVAKTSEKNKVYFYDRKDAAAKGYSPCKSCNP